MGREGSAINACLCMNGASSEIQRQADKGIHRGWPRETERVKAVRPGLGKKNWSVRLPGVGSWAER